MRISGYVLEDAAERLNENLEAGLAELKGLLIKYKDDSEVKEIAQRLEKTGAKSEIEELKNLAQLRKLENSGGATSLPFYRKKDGTAGSR